MEIINPNESINTLGNTLLDVAASTISLLDICTDSPVNNVVIGGSLALLLHGLNIPDNKVNDIDLIVYSPTCKQLDVIKELSKITTDIVNNTSSDIRRSFKSKIKSVEVDFLLEKDLKMPSNLLSVTVKKDNKSYTVPVQSVNNVIDARKVYKRPKDYESCISLKNTNFNI